MPDLPTHDCTYCGRPLTMRENEDASNFRVRKFCGYIGVNRFRHHGAHLGDPDCRPHGAPRETPLDEAAKRVIAARATVVRRFPGARVETADEAPRQCDRCGGLWKLDVGALACRLCGRRCYIAAWLRMAVHETFA